MILHRRSACTQTWLVIGIQKRSLFLQRCHNWLPSPLSVASIVWANPSFSERFSLTETLICLKTWSTEAALCRMRSKKTWMDCGRWLCSMGYFTEWVSHMRAVGLDASHTSETHFWQEMPAEAEVCVEWHILHVSLVYYYVSLFH